MHSFFLLLTSITHIHDRNNYITFFAVGVPIMFSNTLQCGANISLLFQRWSCEFDWDAPYYSYLLEQRLSTISLFLF